MKAKNHAMGHSSCQRENRSSTPSPPTQWGVAPVVGIEAAAGELVHDPTARPTAPREKVTREREQAAGSGISHAPDASKKVKPSPHQVNCAREADFGTWARYGERNRQNVRRERRRVSSRYIGFGLTQRPVQRLGGGQDSIPGRHSACGGRSSPLNKIITPLKAGNQPMFRDAVWVIRP